MAAFGHKQTFKIFALAHFGTEISIAVGSVALTILCVLDSDKQTVSEDNETIPYLLLPASI